MDKSNLLNIQRLARDENDLNKVRLILNELQHHTTNEVPDPYYGGDNGFESVYKMLDEACTVIVSKLK